jgi:tetratricopeptide (TPR) repeat protein
VSTAREYLDNLARSAGQDRALIVELAEAYERLANTQGGASSVNMAEMNAALKSRQKAVELRRQLAGQNQVQDAILIHLMGAVSDDLRNMGRLAEAMKVARESVQLSQRLLHGHDPRSRLERSGAHQSLARVLHDLGHLEEADLEMQAAEQDIVDLTEERQRRRVLAVWQDRADLLHSLGRLSEAVRILEKAEQEADRLVASAPPGARRNAILRNRQVTWANLAQIYDNPSSASLDDPDRALHYREKLCKGWEHLISLDRNNTVAAIDLAVCESETAVTLLKRNPTEAIRFARKGLDAFERLEREAPTQTFRVYRSARGATRLAMALIAANRFEEASRHLETSVRKHRDLMAGHVDNPLYRTSLAWTLTVTARAQHGMHRTAEARKSLEEAIRLMEPLQNSLEAYYLRVAADAVQLLAELAQGPERCSLLERVRNLWNGWKGSGSSWVDARRQQAAQMAAGCRTAALKHDAATGAPLPPSRVTISTFSKK